MSGSGETEAPTVTAAFICGVIGAIIGLVPILGLIAVPLGIIALILGIMGWRRKPERAKLAIASTFLGVVAIVLGVIGVVIVSNLLSDIG